MTSTKITIWGCAAIALALSIAGSAYLVREQWRQELQAVDGRLAANAAQLTFLLSDALDAAHGPGTAQPVDLSRLISHWGQADPALVQIRLQSQSGIVLAEFERPSSSPRLTHVSAVDDGHLGNASLTMARSLSPSLERRARLIWELFTANLVLAAAASAISALLIAHGKAVRRYRTLLATAQALLNRSDSPDLLDAICSAAVTEGGFALVWIAMIQGSGSLRPTAMAGPAIGYAERLRDICGDPGAPGGMGPGGIAMREGREIICNDFRHDPLTAPWAEPARRFGIRSSAALPLQREGQPIGILGLYSSERGHFDTSELMLIRQLAGDISLGLEHARRGAEIERNNERLRTVLDGVPTCICLLSLDGVVLEINRAPLESMKLDRSDMIGKPFAHTYPFADPPASLARLRSALRLAAEGESVRYDELVRIADGTHITVDLIFSPLRDEEHRVLQIVASAADITQRKAAEREVRASAERLRGLSRRLMEVEESERRNINRELHDRVGQNLAALNLNLGLIRSSMAADGTGTPLAERLGAAQALLESTLTDIRDLMAELHPPALDDYGLFAALRVYVESLQRTTDLPVTIIGRDSELPMRSEVALALFRIAQGALTNAAKHACARRITVELSSGPEAVSLVIADDGRGFDTAEERSATSSWGLNIMRERAESIGARLRIESAPGAGTRIIVALGAHYAPGAL